MRHLWLLLRLRLLLTIRGFAGKPGRAAMALMALLVMVPLGIGGAIVLYLVAQGTPPESREAFATVVACVAALTLMMGPNAARPAGGLPLARCLILPIRGRVLLAAGLAGGLVSGPGVLAIPALLGFALGLPPVGPLAVVARLGLALLLIAFAIAFAGLVGLIGAWLLRSRRAREAAVLVAPFLFLGLWLTPQALFGRGEAAFGRTLQLAGRVFPPAWIGRAMGTVGDGAGPAVWAPVLAGALPLTLLLYWVDARLFDRLARAESAGRRRGGATWQWPAWLQLPRLLPPPAGEVMRREWTLAFREPGYRLYLVQFGILALFPIFFAIIFNTTAAAGTPLLVMLGLMLLGKEWRLSSNLFGLEGYGLRYTFALPVDRTRLVLGKVAAHGALFVVVNAGVLGFAGALMGQTRPALIVLLAVEAGLLVQLGCGALTTVYLPHRMAQRGRSTLEGPEAVYEDWGTGCLRAIGGWVTFACSLPPITAVLLVGLLGPGGLGWLGDRAWLFALAATCFALVYGLSFVWYGVRRAAQLLPQREERMLEVVEE